MERTIIESIGDGDLGVVLPKVLLDKLRLREGDELIALQDGANIVLMPATDDLKETLRLCNEGMLQYKDVLEKLKKDD